MAVMSGGKGTPVGVYMSSESYGFQQDGQSDTILGLVVVDPVNTKLTELRNMLDKQFDMLPKDYKFLTSKGWPVKCNQETSLQVCQVLDSDGIVRILTRYEKPRVGICTSDGDAIGFVFIKHTCTVSQLRETILTQIESSPPPLQDSSFVFLDRNMWPLSTEQENHFNVLDILSGAQINIRIRERPSSDDDTFPLSDLPSSPTSLSPPTKKFKRSNPIGHSTGQSPSKIVKFQNTNDTGSAAKNVDLPVLKTPQVAKQMLISYVRQEAAHHALALKSALEKIQFSVYLDVHEITCGADWQDALNYAVSNCEVFVPLVTPGYGNTQWTNREVKLADVLGKIIIPVSFLQRWPPACLAIQFATTQYVRWKTRDEIKQAQERGEGETATDIKYWEPNYVERVAKAIGEFCKAESKKLKFYGPSKGLSRKQSMLKSYAASLPEGANELASIQADREGKPLVVISLHPAQQSYAAKLKLMFEADGYEVWCSTDMLESSELEVGRPFRFEALPRSASDDYSGPSLSQLSHSSNDSVQEPDDERSIFQEKADEAGVVVFVLSKAFAQSKTCQQQVFYCEHRKRVVPLKYEDFEMPGWMSMLIGTRTFEDFRRDGYADSLRSRVKRALDPKARESCFDDINEAKMTVHINFIKRSLPDFHNVVYISGGTKFFWEKTESICKAIGKSLAQHDSIIVVTGGFYGVGETVARSFLDARNVANKREENLWHIVPARDDQDRRLQTRQASDRTFLSVPFGQSLFSGESVRQREAIVARVFDICILIEGGPGAAHEAEEFAWNDHTVIPIKCTGGAAGGKFNVPKKIYEVPNGVDVKDWQLLGNQGADAESIGEAVARIVLAIQKCPTKRLPFHSCPPGSPLRRLIPRMTIIPPQQSPPPLLSPMKPQMLSPSQFPV